MQKRFITAVAAAAVVVIALGGASAAVATTTSAADAARAAGLVSLTASVACDPADTSRSTIIWTVWNKRPFEATITSVEGDRANLAAAEAVGSGVPALGSDAPGSTTIVQTVAGGSSARLSVAAHWRVDDRTLSTGAISVAGPDCRRQP